MNLFEPEQGIFLSFILAVQKTSSGLILMDWGYSSFVLSDKAAYDWEILGLNVALFVILLYNIKEVRENKKLMALHKHKQEEFRKFENDE